MLAFVPSAQDIGWLLLLYVIVPIAWVAGLIRLRSHRNRALWTVLIALVYIAWALAIRTDKYTLTVQFLHADRRPISGLTVSYFTHPQSDRIGRFTAALEGQISTDARGEITLQPNHAHGISLRVSDRRFQDAGFRIEAAGRRYGHQMHPSDALTFIERPQPSPATSPSHDTWVFDPQPQHRIVVALKSR
jgi:hypothetical protein